MSNDKYIFSIILPVYNVADYLEQCIRSLYQQDISLDDYEVIVVDDCSPDNSKEIVLSLQSEYHNLKLISLTENVKLGSARNIGLQNANGKYIWFIDSDDFVQPNALKLFYNELEKEYIEILHFDYKEYDDSEKKLCPYRVSYELEICSGTEFLFDQHELWWEKGVEVWRRVYRRSFLIENQLIFAENIMYEDVDYSIRMFAIAKRVKHINASPYCYRKNLSSITNSIITPMHVKYWILLILRCYTLLESFVKNKELDSRFIGIVDEFIVYQLGCVFDAVKKFNNENQETYYSLVKDIDINVLKKYLSLKKYIYIKYPRYRFLIDFIFRK